MLRALRTAALILACLALLSGIAYYFSRDVETTVVELPAPSPESSASHSADELGLGLYTRAAVTPQTVQAVVGQTLQRARNYSRTVTVERFWDGGSAAETIQCLVRDDDVHLVSEGRGERRHVLLAGDRIYVWYGDTPRSVTDVPRSAGTADAFTGILTYEELLALDPEQITAADYVVLDGEPCIFADYDAGTLGYSSRVYISIATGLLMGAERYDGGTLVYRMTSGAPVLEIPEESNFTPPSV